MHHGCNSKSIQPNDGPGGKRGEKKKKREREYARKDTREKIREKRYARKVEKIRENGNV
jgi:hypothetical protein